VYNPPCFARPLPILASSVFGEPETGKTGFMRMVRASIMSVHAGDEAPMIVIDLPAEACLDIVRGVPWFRG